MEAAIEREEIKWQELDGRAYRNFGPANTDQEDMLSALNAKVSEVYNMVVGDSESNLGMASDLSNEISMGVDLKAQLPQLKDLPHH